MGPTSTMARMTVRSPSPAPPVGAMRTTASGSVRSFHSRDGGLRRGSPLPDENNSNPIGGKQWKTTQYKALARIAVLAMWHAMQNATDMPHSEPSLKRTTKRFVKRSKRKRSALRLPRRNRGGSGDVSQLSKVHYGQPST